MLDTHTANHLATRLDNQVHPDERGEVLTEILSLLQDEPSLLDTHSWSEMRRLAESRS